MLHVTFFLIGLTDLIVLKKSAFSLSYSKKATGLEFDSFYMEMGVVQLTLSTP